MGSQTAAAQTVEYYHLDALGSVRAITNQSGAIIVRHDFLPFGEEWNPPLSSDRRMFTGKERDLETGFDYFGARYLAAKLGRFTTVDPQMTLPETLADPQLWNRYSYVRNNPLRYTDPDGRAIDILMDIGFIAYDLFDIARSLARGEGVTGIQGKALGADVVGAIVPFGTGFGMAVRAANRAENALRAARSAAALTEDLTAAARRAGNAVGSGSGAAHGTRVHSAFEAEVRALGRGSNLRTEVSYLNGQVVPRGTPGSVRLDVVNYGPRGEVLGVYDLKTGGATLTLGRIKEIQAHIPGGAKVPIKEIKQ